MPYNSLMANQEDEGIDCIDAEPTRDRVSTKEIGSTIAWYYDLYIFGCIALYIADVGTDLAVSVNYFRDGDYIWFSLTIACVLGASLVMMMFSLKWFYDDTAEEVSKIQIVVLHVLQLGPLKRYWDCCRNGIRSRKKGSDGTCYSIYTEQWRDIAMLRLFEVFIESAPQLVLQLYILAYRRHFDKSEDWWTALSACFSLLSLSTSIVSYSKALRDASDDKGKMSWWGFGCQIIWRIFMVASRIVTLVLFASVYRSWILLLIGLHWVAMTIWIRRQKTSFFKDNRVLRFMYPIVIGFVYVFCFFNVKAGKTRKRLVFYYALMFVENCALMVAWLPYRHEYGVVFVAAVGMVFGGFFVGVVALLLYYQCYHPTRPRQGICIRASHDVPRKDGVLCPMFCCSSSCCSVQYQENEEPSAPVGSELHIDIPATRGSLGRHVAHDRPTSLSSPLESEILFHKPSQLQKQYSLDKDKIKKEKAKRARQRHSIEASVQNGVPKLVVATMSDVVHPHSNGTVPHENIPSQDIEANQFQKREARNENGMLYSVDVHADHSPNLDNRQGWHDFGEQKERETTADEASGAERMQFVDLNHNTSCDVENVAPGRGTVEVIRESRRDDGVHCGTHDEQESRDRVTSGRTPCDDRVHSGTEDEQKTVSKSETPCDDGVHCGTDDEQETSKQGKDAQGRHDHVDGTCTLPGSHVHDTCKTHPSEVDTKIPKHCDSVKFHHRYSIVSDCISLSSSSTSDNEEDAILTAENKDEYLSWTDPDLNVDGNSNVSESSPSSSSQYAQVKEIESPPGSHDARRNPKQRTINRRSKQSSRVSFPNFVATNLKRGKFSSLRRSREDCTKEVDTRRHTMDFSVLTERGSHDESVPTRGTTTLGTKKMGSATGEMDKLSLT